MSKESLPEVTQNGKAKELKQLKTNENKPAILKIKKYLESHYQFRYNIIANQLEMCPKGENKFGELNEDDLYVELLTRGFKFSKFVLEALLKSSFVVKYDPFREYFHRLPKWNGKRDYIGELARYVKIDLSNRERFDLHFKKALVRTVACALGHGFNKQAFVLIGKQNDGKSSFIRFLCPPALSDYIKEDITPDKEGRIALAQNFLINLDELATLSKYDINNLKKLFSLDKIKDRLVYGKKDVVMPRRASFWGSTNREEFLTDETGSVRWICFHEEGFDFRYQQTVNIDNIYAQAYSLLKDDYDYKVSVEELKENDQINRRYQVTTDEINLIQKYYLPGAENNEFMTATDLLIELLRITEGKVKLNSVMIGRALNFLGYVQKTRRENDEENRENSEKTPIKGYYIRRVSDQKT